MCVCGREEVSIHVGEGNIITAVCAEQDGDQCIEGECILSCLSHFTASTELFFPPRFYEGLILTLVISIAPAGLEKLPSAS